MPRIEKEITIELDKVKQSQHKIKKLRNPNVVRMNHSPIPSQRFAFNIGTGNYNVHINYPEGLHVSIMGEKRRSRIQKLRKYPAMKKVNFHLNDNTKHYYDAIKESNNNSCYCLTTQDYFTWISNFSLESRSYLDNLKVNGTKDGRYVFQNAKLKTLRSTGLNIYNFLSTQHPDLMPNINDHLIIDEINNQGIISSDVYLYLFLRKTSNLQLEDSEVEAKIPKGPYSLEKEIAVSPQSFLTCHEKTLMLVVEPQQVTNKWEQFFQSASVEIDPTDKEGLMPIAQEQGSPSINYLAQEPTNSETISAESTSRFSPRNG